MLISADLSISEQWKQKQKILKRLKQVACLSVTDSIQLRDNYLKTCIDFIDSQTFDSLYGGLLIKQAFPKQTVANHDSNPSLIYYSKPIITNLYLCEVFISADHVFYDGRFRYLAKQMLPDIMARLSTECNGLIRSEYCCPLEKLPCFFSMETIEQLLETKEKELLMALVLHQPYENESNNSVNNSVNNSTNKKTKNGVLFSYGCSLTSAAKKINMPSKEAQMIEFSLVNKLKNKKPVENTCKEKELEDYFDYNCKIVTSLCQLFSLDRRQEILLQATKHFKTLYHYLTEKQLNHQQVNSLIASGNLLVKQQPAVHVSLLLDKLNLRSKNLPIA